MYDWQGHLAGRLNASFPLGNFNISMSVLRDDLDADNANND